VTVRFGPLWSRVRQLDEAGDLPEWMTDRQQRARATRERVLSAASRLLERRPFVEVTMQDLAAEADVSVGALYARFPSKDAVLALLGLAVFAHVCDRLVRALDAVPVREGLRGVVEAYVDTLVAALYRFRSVVLALRKHAPGSPEISGLISGGNRAIHQTFLGRARRHVGEIGREHPDAALQWALFMTNAAAREAVLADALSHYTVGRGRRELRRELSHAAWAYLQGRPLDPG
jgi:AcrR family transcriptional regulator